MQEERVINPPNVQNVMMFMLAEQDLLNKKRKELVNQLWCVKFLIITGKPVLSDTRDRQTLAHNGQIFIEQNFSFIKSLKYFSI